MRKVKLNLDLLKVDSFETAARAREGKGTVFGHATLACSDHFTCTSCDSDYTRLENSCGATCGGACGPQTYMIQGCFPQTE
ncbi:MAG TPA: hypothetical protein VFR81_05305 [Longimicrobium sp.]|nr:hypothetical protein [Longimicrobium sp.]